MKICRPKLKVLVEDWNFKKYTWAENSLFFVLVCFQNTRPVPVIYKNIYCHRFSFITGPIWHKLVVSRKGHTFLSPISKVLKIIVTRGALHICMHPTVLWAMPNLENS